MHSIKAILSTSGKQPPISPPQNGDSRITNDIWNLQKRNKAQKAHPQSIFVHKICPTTSHSQAYQNNPHSSPCRLSPTSSLTCTLPRRAHWNKHLHYIFRTYKVELKAWVSGLTYAGIMVLDIQKIPTTRAVIAPPGIFTATFRALASFLLFAFINI